MADKVMDVLKSKYLISPIHYEGLQRIERLEVPEDALREAIFNSIIHKDYTGAPIQLSVYNSKLILWNEGRLPEDFTIETLLGKHPSRPYNKNVADIFFKAGFIEAWGRGIAKIINGFTSVGLTAPVFEATMGGILLTIERGVKDSKVSGEKSNVVETVVENEGHIVELIKNKRSITAKEIAENLTVSERTVQRYLKALQDNKTIKRIGSAKGGHWEVIDK